MPERTILTRAQIRRTLAKRRGLMADIAREIGVNQASVSQVLRGLKISARIMETCTDKALALKAEESATETA